MRQKSLLIAAAITLLAVLAWGCGEDPDCVTCHHEVLPKYLPQTSPENVVNNLAASYERREIDQYGVLLDPQFIFKFQTADIPSDLERDYWNRDEDSTGTGALFSAANEVNAIYVDLGAFTVEDSIRVDQPDVKRIRLTHVKLEVELSNGATLLVQGDIQDMYFRRGNAAAGTDSTKWYLLEWRDQSGGGLKPTSGTWGRAVDRNAPAAVTISAMSWGAIKNRFR